MIIKALPTVGPKTMIALGITYRDGAYDLPDATLVDEDRDHATVVVKGQTLKLKKPSTAIETEADAALKRKMP